MSKTVIVALGAFGVLGLLVLMLLVGAIGFHNKEVQLRNLINATQVDNKNSMDNMWKKISQVTQVTDEQKNALVEIFQSYTEGRGSTGGGLMKWVQEAVPNVDQTTFQNLQNIVTASRDTFKRNQTELLDRKREHDNLIAMFPGNIYAMAFGRHSIDVVIVTSSRTENAFETGTDDDVSLRGNQ